MPRLGRSSLSNNSKNVFPEVILWFEFFCAVQHLPWFYSTLLNILFPVLADEEGPEGLTQFLMTEVRRLREARKSQLQREQQLQARGRALEEERAGLEQRLREQQQAQERCQRLREDWEAGSLELLRLKDENYMIAMRLAQLSEEKNSAVLRSRDLQLAVGPGEAVGLGREGRCLNSKKVVTWSSVCASEPSSTRF